jgi:hypothetical protein
MEFYKIFLLIEAVKVIERFGPQVEASEIEKSIEKNLLD